MQKVTDRDGCTPLYCAAAWNRIEAVRLLESLHCPSSLRSLEGRTPVHVAAEQGWVELVEVLVRELGNQADARDNYQFTPLHSGAPRFWPPQLPGTGDGGGVLQGAGVGCRRGRGQARRLCLMLAALRPPLSLTCLPQPPMAGT